MSDPIKKITLKDGTVRYRFVVDIGRDPETDKRQQKTFTFEPGAKPVPSTTRSDTSPTRARTSGLRR